MTSAAMQAPAPLPQQPALPPMKVLRDDTLAYEFEYPAETAAGKPLPLLLSRKPERYSSAAPLTADARQRIVCELADLIDAVTVSVTVRRCFLDSCFVLMAPACSVALLPGSWRTCKMRSLAAVMVGAYRPPRPSVLA